VETVAKDRLDRRAIAVSHFSRGGLKNEFGLKWDSGKGWDLARDPDRPDRILAHRWLQVLIDGYRAGHLPKRLPYKLTELRGLLASLKATGRLKDRSLLQGLFNRALEGTADSTRARQAREVAMNLWIDEVLDGRYSRAADPLIFAARFVEEANAEEEMQ
jgi:hypothetical protein